MKKVLITLEKERLGLNIYNSYTMITFKQRNFGLVIIIAFILSFLTNNEIEYIVPNTIVTVVFAYILSSIIWSVFFKKKEFTGIMFWTMLIGAIAYMVQLYL